MVKRCGIFLILCILAAVLAGCLSGRPEPAPGGEGESRLIAAVQLDPRAGRPWTELSKYEGDLDGDGTDETLQLLVSAERAPNGEIMWDDGQPWLLLVTDGTEYYPMLDEYVQLGSVYFTVAESVETKKTDITVLVTTGAGLRMTKAAFSPEEKGYREEPVYATGGINLRHTSFPGYR